jgi:lysine-specific demethylase 8
MQVTGEAQRLEGVSPRDFVERYEPSDQPFVIAGGALDWLAVSRWSPEYLKKLIGSVVLPHKLSASHQHPNFHAPTLKETFARATSTVSELIDRITTGPREERSRVLFTGDERFLLRRRDGETTLDSELSPLYRDVELPPYVPREHLYTVWAWFSGPGVRTWLHYDNNGCHNLNAQITGEKECLLFAPAEIDRLYPFSPDGPNPAHNCSAVDVEAPDLEKFPAFGGARALRAELAAGDLLFIPAWWSHTVVPRGDFNSNVNFWWKPEHPRDNAVSRRESTLARHRPAS